MGNASQSCLADVSDSGGKAACCWRGGGNTLSISVTPRPLLGSTSCPTPRSYARDEGSSCLNSCAGGGYGEVNVSGFGLVPLMKLGDSPDKFSPQNGGRSSLKQLGLRLEHSLSECDLLDVLHSPAQSSRCVSRSSPLTSQSSQGSQSILGDLPYVIRDRRSL